MPDYARMLEAAVDAVSEAALICREVQASLEQVRSITKDDKSPVTVADFASQAIVAYVLRERLGDVELVAEETSAFLRDEDHANHLAATLAAVKGRWPECDEDSLLEAIDRGAGDTRHHGFWTLDPIDGTKGFLRGQQYAIALAYVEAAAPVVGVLGCPNLPRDLSADLEEADPDGTIYAAIRGDGAMESLARGPGEANEPIRITRLDHEPGEEIAITASVEKTHSSVSDTDRMLDELRERHGEVVGEPVRLDSQCKYAVVARGQADAYLRLPTRPGYVERIWDHAAGALIAAETQAAVTDVAGRELDFGRGRGLEANRGIICAPPRLHGLLIGAASRLGLADR